MAINQYIGMNRGDTEFSIVQSGSTTSKSLELTWDTAQWPDRAQFLAALQAIEDAVVKSSWPAA
jgi:hypothetical protein